MQFWKTV